jgi:formylmethanofuran dehydrogenase subunit D
VYPYTYKSLDKLAIFLGLDIDELKKMDMNDALELYMKKCASIGMAEQIKIKWTSGDTFSVESINCSTAAVRSKIPKEEIKGCICPWALLAASLVNKLTGKDLEISASEFNEVGAKTELKVKDTRV